MSLKAMVGQLMTCRDSFTQAAQTWCNVENIHVRGTQMLQDCWTILLPSSSTYDYCGYKVLNSMANIPLPNFTMLSGRSYDHVLALKPQESTHDRNQHVLPLVVLHKLYQVEITHRQRNVPWKTLLDLLFTHKYMIVDWPVGVPAISQHFNVKHLTADELCALTVPFLKEQMGNDYHMETRLDGDNKHGDYIVPEPASSFSLKPWTADQLALVCMMNLKAFEIPLVMDTFGQPLCLLSDLQVFLKGVPRGIIMHDILPPTPTHQCHTPTIITIVSHKSVTGSIRRIFQREGPTAVAVWWSMSIAALLIRDITIIPLMKMTIPAHTVSTTEIVTDAQSNSTSCEMYDTCGAQPPSYIDTDLVDLVDSI
ncbi:hypothetical protein EDD16DRAFT_1524342 [Pisolithus croceorrhizus]|nr:hypothetical protein EDD16DRAFT_1524342 [Pisolithus croceorrhizus]KAI6169194.1 hypothetical protein EDD17DRAFT_1503108 [Pisolithus thermaeus]